MHPKISIITPSFNQGQFIEQTICSVLDQNYPNIEFIIIDGGSKDNTLEIIKKYHKHLAYWVSEPDNGQTDAINKGTKLVTGDICNWLCSDDYLEPGSLFKIAEAFGDNSNIHVVSGKLRLFNDTTGYNEIFNGTILYENLAKTIIKSYNSQPSTFFRTQYFKQANIHNALHWYMCYELWLKYLILNGQNNFLKINDLLVHYRLHNASKTETESQTSLDKNNKYTIDRNSIIHSIALNAGLNDKIPAILNLSDRILQNYNINIDFTDKKILAKEIINYYLYFNAERYYYERDKKTAALLFNNVEKNLLFTKDEKDNFIKLKKRSTLEPYLKPLRNIKILRNIKTFISKK